MAMCLLPLLLSELHHNDEIITYQSCTELGIIEVRFV